jgi:hypothetical protein
MSEMLKMIRLNVVGNKGYILVPKDLLDKSWKTDCKIQFVCKDKEIMITRLS